MQAAYNLGTFHLFLYFPIISKNPASSAYLREAQKRRVMYSHRYSLFMELTSIFVVFMISDALLFSFILLFR